MMTAQVIRLAAHEPVVIEAERIAVLRESLGAERCREVVSAVAKHISDRLARLESALPSGDPAEASRLAARISSLSEQVGLADLARVARDLRLCLDAGEDSATAAVAARLNRLGEESLAVLLSRIGGSAL